MKTKLLLVLILALVMALGVALSCDDDDDDDDDVVDDDITDDDTADDDVADDDVADDDVADDDVADDDVVDDDITDDDITGDPFLDGGFDEASWEPCAGLGCVSIAYATVSDVYVVQQTSEAMMAVGDTSHIMVSWQMAGDTVAGDYDLTLLDKEVITHFALLFVNVTIVSTTEMTQDIVYITTGGNMNITEIGQTMGASFSGELQNTVWSEAELVGNTVNVIPDGKTGTIDSILGSGMVIRLPM